MLSALAKPNDFGVSGLSKEEKPCRNPESRRVIKLHRRVVALHNQSTHASIQHSTRKHSALLTLQPTIDPVVARFRLERADAAVIVEDLDSDDEGAEGGARTRDVRASELGFSSADWAESQELEALLKFPNSCARTVEMNPAVTGAQALQMMVVWYNQSHEKPGLGLLGLPKSLKLRVYGGFTGLKGSCTSGLLAGSTFSRASEISHTSHTHHALCTHQHSRYNHHLS